MRLICFIALSFFTLFGWIGIWKMFFFSLVKKEPKKYASQDKAFRRVHTAAGALPLDPAIFREKLSKALEPVFIIRGCRMGEGFCCPARRKNADNTLCIARFFNAAGRQKTRSDGVEWL
ncbi:hypothetical protein [Anaerotruncus sp. G3(2012)]|uniref:hypothetical protein n=1 Tax=Anaerotruncus sp. G3(2012) TaxID=1235835 RepID=UPI0012DFA69A|nr:hypothetical protein [Anaerotruncus sp. G3(2012)]